MNSHRAVRVFATPLLVAIALLLATMQTPVAHGAASTYVVDNLGDTLAVPPVCSAAPNDCSLREAITKANTSGPVDQDLISFAGLGPAGTVQTITFVSAPPAITQLVRIDGGTAPAGRVELRGIIFVGGLQIRSSNVVINKLALNGFGGGDGLFVDGVPAPISNITLSNNRIGIGKTADTDEGNAGDGIEVKGSVTNLTISASTIGNNNEYGIRFTNVFTGPNTIQSSNIGVTVGGADHGNGLGGILATGQAIIGGVGSNRNYISGNTGSGIVLSGTADAIVEGNRIGLSSLDTVVPNTLHGIRVSSPGDAAIRDNVISGNLMHGVLLNLATGTYLGGNYIGTNGSQARPNGQDGVHISATSSDIHIGFASERNVISGNEESGIEIEAGADEIEIIGNRIGTEFKGLAAVPNDTGITSAGTNVLIEENLLSGNAAYGVHLPGGSGAVLRRNYIGTNVSASAALSNGDTGVRIDSPGNQIGDGPVADRNIISGNFYGLSISGGGNFIENNYIGTNLAGTAAIPNHVGIRIDAPSIIGADFGSDSLRNVISGNTNTAVEVGGDGVLIRHNIIGQRADFAGPLPNVTGILITGDNNGVYNNIIDGNTATGVAVDVIGQNNGIANNEIHDNGDLGVDLDWDGPTSNDGDDPDTGGNNLQNYPIIVAAYPTKLHWTLDTVPGMSYIVTASHAEGGCDPSGFGEGGDLVKEEVFENITGDLDVTWDLATKVQLELGEEVTMYASVYLGDIDRYAGDTSEFSQCAETVTEPPPTPTPTPATPTPTPTVATATPTPTATATPVGTPTATATPIATATHTPVATTTPTGTPSGALRQGDVTCDGDIDEEDVIALLIYDQLQPGDEDPCPLVIGDDEPITGFEWGDVNCDGAIDGFDALLVLLFAAELDTPEPAAECVPPGDPIVVP